MSQYYPILIFPANLEAQLAKKNENTTSLKGRKYYQGKGLNLVASVENFNPTLLGNFAEDFWLKFANSARHFCFFSFGLTNIGFIYLLVKRGWNIDIFVLWGLTLALIIGVFFQSNLYLCD